MRSIKPIKQLYSSDCGPTCLKMVTAMYDKQVSIAKLREWCELNKNGVNMYGISQAAEQVGFRTLGVKTSAEKLMEAPLPCILHWNENHFVVLEKISTKGEFVTIWSKFKSKDKDKNAAERKEESGAPDKNDLNYSIADPAHGILKLNAEEFKKCWYRNKDNEGVVLLLEPAPNFYVAQAEESETPKRGFGFLFGYLRGYKAYITQVMIGLLGVSLLQLIFPFLTQGVVDRGIHFKDTNFVLIMLIAQLMLLAGQFVIEFIRGWILLHISSRINIALVSDFLAKLVRLPHSYFESKMTADILQRIGDHSRVQSFITQNSLMTLFSTFNFIVFSVVLSLYSWVLLGLFTAFTAIYIFWVMFFLKRRKELDYKRFNVAMQNQDKMLQLIQGIHEIKLHNAENNKRWDWERQQIKLFDVGLSSMRLQQVQEGGAFTINQLKNILISFISAKAVIDGEMSLGMMMSVQYIIGQMNSPIQQLIGFIRGGQDAKISLDRISEVYSEKDEYQLHTSNEVTLPTNKDIEFRNICYRYPGTGDNWVLDDISLSIPQGKTTAIVGVSGSGKTTLLKLLLKYQIAQKGSIVVGGMDLQQIHPAIWRSCVGGVMQDGFIYGDTVAGNIVMDGSKADRERLKTATEVAEIRDFIEALPTGYNTKLGSDGINVSTGQKQRLLIARAIYKNPDILLFDEATNALDTINERKIAENLNRFCKDKTMVVVAHRLSTVKNADNIIVLDKGKIVEQGSHKELTALRGHYYTLVKNQLELGN